MGLSIPDAKAKIDAIFEAMGTAGQASVLPTALTQGKVYEAWVLAQLLGEFDAQPGCKVRLVNGSSLVLKSSPGPINSDYPHFEVTRASRQSLDVWTDVEFTTLSHARRGAGGWPGSGDRHELDIAFVPSGTTGYPSFDLIRWGIECKHTLFEKQMARAALGVRRELSYLQGPQRTDFDGWPKEFVPASPPSILSVYSTSPKVALYADAGEVFGVDFEQMTL